MVSVLAVGCDWDSTCTCNDRANSFFRSRIDWSYQILRLASRSQIASTLTHLMNSFESTEGTNSLLMKRPVGTVISLPDNGIFTTVLCAIVLVDKSLIERS